MLKYLFVAEFADGSSVEQTQDDVSNTDPTKSAFFDVLNHPSELLSFRLSSGLHIVSLDLRTGQFQTDGFAFSVHDPSKPVVTTPRRLIYFRNVTRHFNATDLSAQDVEIIYHIGWQTTLENGENIQHTIAVK